MNKIEYICTAEDESQRLDYVLAKALPDTSLRGRKRLCKQEQVFLNSKLAKPSDKVRENSIITIDVSSISEDTLESEEWGAHDSSSISTSMSSDISNIDDTCPKTSPDTASKKHDDIHDGESKETNPRSSFLGTVTRKTQEDQPLPLIVHQNESYAAIHKAAHTHSASIAGVNNYSVEKHLPSLFPQKTALLLNRLDFATSGILMVAFSPEAEEEWKYYQGNNRIKKTYISMVEGKVENEFNIKTAIALKKKHKVRVNKSAPGQRRTQVFPLAHAKDKDNNDVSLILCTITQGARHQIRAHLTSIGHPLVGDVKYGAKKQYARADFMDFSLLQSPFSLYTLDSNSKAIQLPQRPTDDEEATRTFLYNLRHQNDSQNNNTQEDITQHDDINATNEAQSTQNNNTQDINDRQGSPENMKDLTQEECFLLHHIKVEFAKFNALCSPSFWKNIPTNIQEYILSRVQS